MLLYLFICYFVILLCLCFCLLGVGSVFDVFMCLCLFRPDLSFLCARKSIYEFPICVFLFFDVFFV